MPDSPTEARRRTASGRSRAQDVDRHVGARVRDRRVALGLTQHGMAELAGVTYQQAHKYERGINRIAAGRLHRIAQALDVEVGHFFEGLGGVAAPGAPEAWPSPPRMPPGLARDFAGMPSRGHQEALCRIARALAGRDQEEAEPALPHAA